jgi:regulator of replication initiation timing
MSQDIEIDPDSRTIKYYEKPDVGSIREDIMMGAHSFKIEAVMVLLDEIDRIQKLVPPESERGPGFVGQGSWSVFAEKVVEERDELRIEVQNLRAWVDIADKAVRERDELRDELSSLCEEIRILKEENDELREELEQLGAMIAAKKERTNTHFNDKKDFVGIDGYGRFSVQKANDCLWILKLPNETVTFYNKKGRRVCANHIHSGVM